MMSQAFCFKDVDNFFRWGNFRMKKFSDDQCVIGMCMNGFRGKEKKVEIVRLVVGNVMTIRL